MAELESSQVMSKLIRFLSSLLERIAERNDVLCASGPQKVSIFNGLTRPTISIEYYLERIFKYANCSQSCLIVAYIYLDRFSQKQPLLPLNSFNAHRLIIASVLLSVKFMDDIFYNNAYYAKVGGISTAEMNLLEMELLFGLGFQLNVSTSTFYTYCSYFHSQMLLESPPLCLAPSAMDLGRTEKLHFTVNEDGSTHQQQLAV